MHERRTTWFELFSDLVFVAALGHVSQLLYATLTVPIVLRFTAAFLVVWWAWMEFTFYSDLFGARDTPRFRFLMLMGVFVALLLSATANTAFTSAHRNFAICYAALQVVGLIRYGFAGMLFPAARALVGRLSTGFGLALVVWLLGLILPAGWSYACFASSLAIQLVTPIVSRDELRCFPYNVSHIPERFGAFTIIAMGEAVSGLAIVLQTTIAPLTIAATALAFILVGSIWWTYFDFLLRKPTPEQLLRAGLRFAYGHFPVTVGILLSGVGASRAISAIYAGAGTLPLDVLWLLCGGVAIFHASFTGLSILLEGWYPRRVSMIKLVAFLFLGVFGTRLPPLAVLSLVAAVMVLGVLAGERARRARE